MINFADAPSTGRYPRIGFAILPTCLRPVFRTVVRHRPLSDGARGTPAADLDRTFWKGRSVEDCEICASAVAERLNFTVSRIRSRRAILASLYFPQLDSVASFAELPLSSGLLNILRRHELLDPWKLRDLAMLDVLELPRFGARRLLELVTILESLGAPFCGPREIAETTTAIRATGTREDVELLQRLEERLGSADILTNDVRFGEQLTSLRTNAPSLKKAIAILKSGAAMRGHADPWPVVRGVLLRIEEQLTALQSGSLENDLLDVLKAIAKKDRKIRALGQRLGWVDGQVRTLQVVGDLEGLTRERVRQYEARAQQALAHRSIYTPRFTDALSIARARAPCRGGEISEALREQGLTINGWAPSTLVATAAFLGISHGLTVSNLGADEYVASVAANADLGEWVLSKAREIIRSEGAASLKDIAYWVSEELERWVSGREVRAIVSALPGVQWLDEDKGWLWFGEQGQNRVLNNIRKMLSVAQILLIDELYEGLIRSYRMDDEPVCPKPIVLALCRQVPWIHVRQLSHLSARGPLAYKDVLVGVERTMVDVLVEAGGALDHYSFRRACLERGVPIGSFGVYEGNSPVFRRIRPSIWGLRGVDVRPSLLSALDEKVTRRQVQLAAAASQRGTSLYAPGSLIGSNAYRKLFGITASTFRHHVMTLARAVGAAPGTQFKVMLDGKELGIVQLREDRRLKGLLPLLRAAGAQTGQTYLAHFDLNQRIIQLERETSSTG